MRRRGPQPAYMARRCLHLNACRSASASSPPASVDCTPPQRLDAVIVGDRVIHETKFGDRFTCNKVLTVWQYNGIPGRHYLSTTATALLLIIGSVTVPLATVSCNGLTSDAVMSSRNVVSFQSR
jgi:hypothetical protein